MAGCMPGGGFALRGGAAGALLSVGVVTGAFRALVLFSELNESGERAGGLGCDAGVGDEPPDCWNKNNLSRIREHNDNEKVLHTGESPRVGGAGGI